MSRRLHGSPSGVGPSAVPSSLSLSLSPLFPTRLRSLSRCRPCHGLTDASMRPGARRPREPQVGAPAPLRRHHGPSPVVRIAGWSSLGLPPRPPRAMPLVEVFAALMKLHAVAAVRQRHTIKCQKEEDRRIQDPILDLALEAVRTGRAPLQACYRVARSLHRQEALCDERRWAGYLSVACLGQPSHLRVCDRYP